MVKSPCTRECHFDDEGEYCAGCLRTLHELKNWRVMSDEKKQAALDRIAEGDKCPTEIKSS